MKTSLRYTLIIVLSLLVVANIVVIIGGYGSFLNVISAGTCLAVAFYVAYKR